MTAMSDPARMEITEAALAGALSAANKIMVGSLIVAALAAVIVAVSTYFVIRWGDKLSELKDASFEAYKVDASKIIALANQSAAMANEHAKQLDWQIEQEREKRAPRFINKDQREALIREAKGKLISLTVAVQRDVEARAFAIQLEIAFSDAGVEIHPIELPPGDVFAAPAGLLIYAPSPHGGNNEKDLKEDPLYKALTAARLFGGNASQPFATLTLSPSTPLIPWGGHVLYVGQKPPW